MVKNVHGVTLPSIPEPFENNLSSLEKQFSNLEVASSKSDVDALGESIFQFD